MILRAVTQLIAGINTMMKHSSTTEVRWIDNTDYSSRYRFHVDCRNSGVKMHQMMQYESS